MKIKAAFVLLFLMVSGQAVAQNTGFDWYSKGSKVFFFAKDTTYYTYEWEFGDALAGTATGTDPMYSYSAFNGLYTVKLTVTDSYSNITTYQNQVGTGNHENSTIPDTTPPVLSFLGDTILLLVNNTLADPGVVITDDRDDITSWDTSGIFYKAFPDGYANLLGTFNIIYKARDKAGNEDSVTRIVMVIDTIPSTISLIGSQVFCYYEGEPINWLDSGYILNDNYWPLIEIEVRALFCDDTAYIKKPGTYRYVGYRAIDLSGNRSDTVWRYYVIKQQGDTSDCVLPDSLKDTCRKYVVVNLNDKASLKDIRIYPNPASNQVIIALSELTGETVSVRLLDISGREILLHRGRSGIQDDKIELNTSSIPNGLYLIEVSTESGTFIERISIAH